MFFRKLQFTFCLVLLLGGTSVLEAQVRSSSNYQIQSDSINAGGGFSSSTNFVQESTVGEIATGIGTSSSYELRAGYQQMQASFISISASPNVVMDTTIDGVIGGVSNGSTTVTVITDDPAGYELSIRASNDPAMQTAGGSSFVDYPAGATPSYNFNFGSTEALFGYSPEGVDIVAAFQNSVGLACNTGSLDDVDACWSGLTDAADGRRIAESTSANHPAGATTTIKFRVGVGATANPNPGDYVATTTLTALPQ